MKMMYPVFVDVSGRAVLIVGGGAVGVRKAVGLLACGAAVTVVSVKFKDEFTGSLGMDVEKVTGAYAAVHMGMKAWRMVFAATDVREVNERVMADAKSVNVLCCRCDEPDEGDFSGGAVERIGNVAIAVSTGGGSPVLAARLAREAKVGIDPVVLRMAALGESWRARVKQLVGDGMVRRELLQKLAGDAMEHALRIEGEPGAQKLFEAWLAAAQGAIEGGASAHH